MQRHTISMTFGALALAAAWPVLGKPPAEGGVGGGVSSTVQGAVGAKGGIGATVRDTARIGAQGSVNADARAMERANVNSAVRAGADATTQTTAKGKAKATTDTIPDAATNARAKAQGAANASVQGLSKASTKSSLNVAGRTDLGAVVKGTEIKGSGGADIGTVSDVVLNRDGAVVGVKVDLEGGGTATIPASTLTIDGSTVVTSWVHKH